MRTRGADSAAWSGEFDSPAGCERASAPVQSGDEYPAAVEAPPDLR